MELYQKINSRLLLDYKSNDDIEWGKRKWQILSKVIFSEEEMDTYKDILDWSYACSYQYMSEKFIEEHLDYIDWNSVSSCQKLSEEFMEKYKDKIRWKQICIYQKLSEDFINKNKDKIFWDLISIFQPLSVIFITQNMNWLDWERVSRYQKFPEKLPEINDNWIYKPTEEKKKAVVNTGLYECHDDYFIAYKAIREDRYSIFNFQYKYEKGGIYESWCDCTGNENSFGLSVGTYEHCRSYAEYGIPYIIVTCKVKYEDVGRVVYDGEKIRCFKIEILE